MLTALLAAGRFCDVTAHAAAAADRLRRSQGRAGLFPHALPRTSLPPYRSHVGCFADQAYPIQALARHHAVTGDENSLLAADRCAAHIVRLQGPAGQWWWHYDVRTGAEFGRSAVAGVPAGGAAVQVGPVVVYRLPERVLGYS